MAEAGVTHHIVLNAEGYIIKPETYQQANQAPLIQRVAMGEADMTSVSNFQFIRHDDFSGGEGQKTFGDPDNDKFWASYGYYPKDIEELRLHRAVELSYSAAINDCILKSFGGRLYLADKTSASLKYSTDGVTFSDFSLPTGYSGAITGMAVVHNDEMEERLLVMSATGIFFSIKTDGTVDTTVGTVAGHGVQTYVALGGTFACLIEWGHAIYFGHDASVMRRTGMEGEEVVNDWTGLVWWFTDVLKSAFTALMGTLGVWLPPDTWLDRFPAGQGVVTCIAPGLSPQRLCVGSYDSTIKKSFITLTNGVAEFSTDKGNAVFFQPGIELPDFEIRSMAGFQNLLIYGGRKEINGRSVGQVYAYPRQLICEIGEDLDDALDYTVRAMSMHENLLFAHSNNVVNSIECPGLFVLTDRGYYSGPCATVTPVDVDDPDWWFDGRFHI